MEFLLKSKTESVSKKFGCYCILLSLLLLLLSRFHSHLFSSYPSLLGLPGVVEPEVEHSALLPVLLVLDTDLLVEDV